MAWTWNNDVTSDSYWISSGDNDLNWYSSGWEPLGDGLQVATLSPFSDEYGYEEGILVDATIRSLRIHYTLTYPPNDYHTIIKVRTTEGQVIESSELEASGTFTAAWTPAPGEGIAGIDIYWFGSFYEMGVITQIDAEMYSVDPDPEPVAVWTGYIHCREIVV